MFNKAKLTDQSMREPKYLEALKDAITYLEVDGNGLKGLKDIVNDAVEYQKELGEFYSKIGEEDGNN